MRTMTNNDRIEDLEQRIERLENAVFQEERDIRSEKELSLAEFLRDCDTPHHSQKAMAIGYFYEVHNERESYSTADVREGYIKARLQKPQNLDDIMGKTAGRGFFLVVDEEDGVRQWALTQTGIDQVEEEL